MLNLTPHPINIILPSGEEIVFPPSGVVSRCSVIYTVTGDVDGIPSVTAVFGEADNLPEEGTPCIVSALVAAAVKGRKGVYSPDGGSTAERSANGQIRAVRRLIAA